MKLAALSSLNFSGEKNSEVKNDNKQIIKAPSFTQLKEKADAFKSTLTPEKTKKISTAATLVSLASTIVFGVLSSKSYKKGHGIRAALSQFASFASLVGVSMGVKGSILAKEAIKKNEKEKLQEQPMQKEIASDIKDMKTEKPEVKTPMKEASLPVSEEKPAVEAPVVSEAKTLPPVKEENAAPESQPALQDNIQASVPLKS